MTPFITFAIGVVIGWRRAAARRGALADKALYAFGHGVALGLLGLALGAVLYHYNVPAPF